MDAQKLPEDVENQIKQLTKWMEGQDCLPNKIDERLPIRFLHSCYYDLNKAKTTAKLFFEIRSSVPELIRDRDPLSAPMQKVLNNINLALYKISGNRNLWVSQMNDPGMKNYDNFLESKLLILYMDAWIMDDKFLQESDILIMDVKYVSLKMLWKVNFSIMRKVAKYQQEATPIRLKEIHMVNTPASMDRIYSIMKNLLRQELRDTIHFHKPESNTLQECFSKEDLPEDYGGTCGAIADGMLKTRALLNKYRDIFLQDGDCWRQEKISKDVASMETDFRSLAIN